MTLVEAPFNLHAALAGPLAVRGLRLAGPTERPAVTVAAAPPAVGRWLALVDDEECAIAVLDAGADDVVLPDCAPSLIAARIARLLQPNVLRIGPLAIDPMARTAERDGRALSLLPREYAVLLQLARHADTPVSRSDLRTAVWGRDFDPGTNVIEVHVSRLRMQLDRGAPPMLLTERGRGYRLVSAPSVAERRRAS